MHVHIYVWDQTTFKIHTYNLAFDHKQATMINESQIVRAEKEKLQPLATKQKKKRKQSMLWLPKSHRTKGPILLTAIKIHALLKYTLGNWYLLEHDSVV